MPVIWCAISGHGYGHAAQVIPVLSELHTARPDATIILRTSVPERVFRDRLPLPWILSPAQMDIGCLQRDALAIDVDGTWQAHEAFHATWEERVQREAALLREHRADVVLADIPYLPMEAAARVGIPCIGLSSLSWDSILALLARPGHRPHAALIETIQRVYAKATVMIRVSPALPMPAFTHVIDVAPIVAPIRTWKAEVRQAAGVDQDERLVVIAFGGLGVQTLPWHAVDAMKGYRFLVPDEVPIGSTRIVSATRLPYAFRSIMASADILLTKPGYGTFVETVAVGTPVVYVRRYNFADEEPLLTYLHTHGIGVELSERDFRAGRWEHALDRISVMGCHSVPAPAPPAAGAAEAASIIHSHLR